MKSGNVARIVILVLFVLFVGLYMVGNSEYYDYSVTHKTKLTEEQIIQFEKDLAEGKPVDVEDYLKLNEKDYDNLISDTTLQISNTISKTFDKALNYLIQKLNDVMDS